MSLVSDLKTLESKTASELVNVGKIITGKVLPLLKSANADAATIESVTGLISPAAAKIETAAFALFGIVVKAIQDGQSAAAAGGVNITLDQSTVNDIKALIPAVQAVVKS